MKKSILTAVAAGALAIGGAASAQDFGTVISNIFGFGQPTYPTYSYPNYGGSTPAVVAGTQPYYGTNGNHNAYPGNTYGGTTYGGQVYVDQYGRQVTIDQYGRHVYVQPNTGNYGITGYDQWGRPIYGTTTYGTTTYGSNTYGYNSWDRDGDGVANNRDRWPDDRRYR
jgi:hypothetical protein